MGELTADERATMRELLDYPNPEGLHFNEVRWRNFARVELGLRDQRIKQLEQLNATLSAEIDLARPVIEAAQSWNNCEYGGDQEEVAGMLLSEVVNAYEAAKEQG